MHWHSHVLNGARHIGSLIFENSHLNHIHRYAIHNAHILCLKFDQDYIKTIDENAFSGSNFDKVEFIDSELEKIGTSLFYETRIETQLLLQRVIFHLTDSRVFASTNIGQMEIANSTFKNFLQRAFEQSNVR